MHEIWNCLIVNTCTQISDQVQPWGISIRIGSCCDGCAMGFYAAIKIIAWFASISANGISCKWGEAYIDLF